MNVGGLKDHGTTDEMDIIRVPDLHEKLLLVPLT